MQEKKGKNIVFYVSLIITFVIVMWGIVFPKNFGDFTNLIFKFLTEKFGWAYIWAMFIFVIFVLILALSKYGNIKLGPDDSKPDFSTVSWFAMLFGAGMGIGLVFWGVAEPLSHFAEPMGVQPGTPEAADFALKVSFKHWGFHPWANYSIIGLALAYFQFRKNKPGLISNIFEPLIGEKRVKGPIGYLIDILAVFATVAGVATSLGLGTLQINSGMNYLFNLPQTKLVQLGIIIIVTLVFIWTAVSGIEKGIKVLSDINLWAAISIVVLSFLIGPSLKMINGFTKNFGIYINSFIQDSLHLEPFGENSWINGWTVFYWAWWIAWAPFVGTFIARISRGRTIREFIIGVIIIPSIASFVWFAIFGTLGINLGMSGKLSLDAIKAITAKPETALFVVMKNYPLGTIVSLIAIFLLCTFFITSANSATFVLGMLTSGGNLNPSNKKKILWGIIQSFMAVALLFAGGLKALQTASIAAAFPFIFVMIFACISLVKALRQEKI